MNSEILLEINGLTHAYSGGLFRKTTVFEDFSLSLEGGKIYALLGRNGAGKTTLLNCVLGLLAYKPGEVRFRGKVMTPGNTHQFLQKITSVASPAEMFPGISADSYVNSHRKIYENWDTELENRIRSMSDFDWTKPIKSLSTGQRMQVLQALALCPEPELLLLDEPLGVTDPVVRKYFYKNLLSIVAERETTVIIATHLINEIANLFDEALFLKQGRLVMRKGLMEMQSTYRKFVFGKLPDVKIEGEAGRLIGDAAIISDHPEKTTMDLQARGMKFKPETPSIEDVFEAFA
ncbi:MAG: ATP-binding cassette domain-containing protein [Acidobacteria bacterium]|nr:ATP-binding cassette domain-containing protein [Acidobacteriota bacterium]